MPLFMLISGYLFHNNSQNLSIKKQLKTLLTPIFIWQSLYSLSYFVLKPNNISFIKYWCISVIGGLWFLWAIFYSSIVIIFVEYFIKNKKLRVIIYILGFIISLIVPDYLGSSVYKFMYPFYILGYYNKNFLSIIISLKRSSYIICLIILFIFYMYLFSFYNYDSYIYTSGYYIFNEKFSSINHLYINLYRFIIGLIGSLLMIFLVNLLNCIKKGKYILKILETLGINSLGIYILTGYMFQIISKVMRNNNLNYFYSVVISCVLIITSLFIIIFIKKYKVLNILLLGGRK